MIKRTHTCGEITSSEKDARVSLNGWISKIRDLGSIIFIDLRDRYGKTQIFFGEETNQKIFKRAKKLSLEDVIGISGKVVLRPDDAINKEILTGSIDIDVDELVVYNESDPMPFDINDRNSASEEHRLKFRYLELRTRELQSNIVVRHKASIAVRQFLNAQDFLEIETPILMKSTPEGARDFLVPSRIHQGKFYALPQSPQTYKQLLMVSGMDKYFQIVKCFRDEDFRADRQPEFTQIDIEMSFIDQSDIIELGTQLIKNIWEEVIDVKLMPDFPVMDYKTAMEQYGSDKPDLRFGMELFDMESYIKDSDFNVFISTIKQKGRVKGIVSDNAEMFTRKKIDELTEFVQKYYKAKGLAWMKWNGDSFEGGISKFFSDDLQKQIASDVGIKENQILFMVGDNEKITLSSLGALRIRLAEELDIIDGSVWSPLWVIDFPLVEWNEDKSRWDSLHHPFTSPNPEDISMIESDPSQVRSFSYDLVMNGYELGGGSIRIYDKDLQGKIFSLLGISKDEAAQKFGFLMDAFKFGAPPHGGIAFGFDRIVMLLANSNQIRDVIAFPKTTSALSLMDSSPTDVDSSQLDELGLKLDVKDKG